MPRQMIEGRRLLTWSVIIGWCLAGLAALVIALALMEIDRSNTSEAGLGNLRNLWPYWIASAWLWMGLSAMWWTLRGRREAARHSGSSTSDVGKRFAGAAWFIFIVAVAARIAVLITHEPALSDDVYRYIFEGRTFAAGFNPYLVKAADRLGAATGTFAGERLLIDTPSDLSTTRLVTYGELSTPYLPVSHLTFGALGLIIRFQEQWSDPISSARVFRAGFMCLEFVTIVLLFAACRRAGRSAWWVALYAWHPLPISEIAGSGHQDIIGITLLIAALLAYSANPRRIARWAGLLTLSVLVKPIAAAAGAMMICKASRESARQAARAALVAVPIAVILLALFWLVPEHSGLAFANWRATVGLLAEKWAHFGGLYELALAIVRRALPAEGQPAGYNLVQELAARRVCMALLIAACVLIFVRSRDAWRGTAAMLLAVALCTTTAHPWYLLWALALFPMANFASLWMLSLTLPWGYAVFTTLGRADWPWTSPWVYVAAYGPVYAAVIVDLVIYFRKRRSEMR